MNILLINNYIYFYIKIFKYMLYIVPTPIGNLEDITLRAIRILKNSKLILVENIYNSKILLNYFNINIPIRSYNINNEHKIIKIILNILKQKDISLISNSGTPCISDPGFLLIRECIKENIKIECLPGPTAFIPALIQSGFPIQEFLFLGFLPKKGKELKIKTISKENRTIIIYESPHRLLKTLYQLKKYLNIKRRISISREISKKFEETIRGNINEQIYFFEKKKPRGEFIIILESFIQ